MKTGISKISIILIAYLFVLLALPVLSAPKEAKNITPDSQIIEGFQLTVQTSKDTFVPTEPIDLSVALQNATDKSLTYVASYPLRDFSIDVQNADGTAIPFTRYGKLLTQNRSTGFAIGTYILGKDEEERHTFSVNRIYDMTIVGEYNITVTHPVPKQDRTGFISLKSNVIHIKIVEPKLAPKFIAPILSK